MSSPGGRTLKTCFVIMPFAEPLEAVYRQAILPAATGVGLQCVRGDQQIGQTVMDDIVRGIEEATVCVADLTGLNPNVIFEAALAISRKKRLILITQSATDTLPFDLRTLRVHRYEDSAEGLELLRSLLRASFEAEIEGLDSPVRLLQAMVRPASLGSGRRHVIAASPLSWRNARQHGGGYKELRRTSSDHVGIRGLIYAFGLTSGLQDLPDLLDPGDYESQVALTPVNLFCIGSSKVNRWTGIMLNEICQARSPRLAFRPDPESDNLRDVHVDLHVNGRKWLPDAWEGSKHRYERDFGLIVRGPHPKDPGALVMVLAGRGAVGTEAACRAVTEDPPLAKIRDLLQRFHGIDLDDHRQAFWVVVEMEREGEIGETRLDSMKVCQVGAFQKSQRAG